MRASSERGEQHLDFPRGDVVQRDKLNQFAVFRLIMPIPGLNQNGLLPRGVHDCTLDEITGSFTGNPHRKRLFQNLVACLKQEIRPVFVHPIFVDGSFVTDKDEPEDVDIVLDLKEASDEQKFRGLMFMKDKQSRFSRTYNVHFLVNVDAPGFPDLSAFFQYVGIKTARIKSLDPRHMKGILRIFQ